MPRQARPNTPDRPNKPILFSKLFTYLWTSHSAVHVGVTTYSISPRQLLDWKKNDNEDRVDKVASDTTSPMLHNCQEKTYVKYRKGQAAY